jgi:hypothetical protein
MPLDELYRRQAALVVQTIPVVAQEDCFALKGGTAINLFVRDMPRLSVDIDLTYLPVTDRSIALLDIDRALNRISDRIAAGIRGARVHKSKLEREDFINKLFVRMGNAQIKIEVTPVLRGSIFESHLTPVAPRVEETFGYAEIKIVSFADLYAGKLVAALDRQHPRDLFDVRDLLANEGIGADLRKAFVVYLISHNRPMAEVLAPSRLDISKEFARGFSGMTDEPVILEELLRVREELIASIVGRMPDAHRRFLLSFKKSEPDWRLLDLPDIEKLPAVQWRLDNLRKMKKDRREALRQRLEKVLAEARQTTSGPT